jgi:hypothetical protein
MPSLHVMLVPSRRSDPRVRSHSISAKMRVRQVCDVTNGHGESQYRLMSLLTQKIL